MRGFFEPNAGLVKVIAAWIAAFAVIAALIPTVLYWLIPEGTAVLLPQTLTFILVFLLFLASFYFLYARALAPSLSKHVLRFASKITETAGDAMLVIDAESLTVVDASVEASTLFSGAVEDGSLIGKSIVNLFPPGELEEATGLFKDFVPWEKPRSADLALAGENEGSTYVNFRVSLLKPGDKPGEKKLLLAVIRDISKQKMDERALSEDHSLISSLVRAAQAMNDCKSVDEILAFLYKDLKESATLSRLSIILRDETSEQTILAHVLPEDSGTQLLGKPVRMKDNPDWEGFLSGQTHRLDTAPIGFDILSSYGIPYSSTTSVAAVLAVNLLHFNASTGLLVFESEDEEAFDDRTTSFLVRVARHAASAIENSKSLTLERQRSKELELVGKLSKKVLESLNVELVLKEAGRGLIELFGYDNVLLFLIGESAEELYLFSSVGKDADFIDVALRLQIGEGIAGLAAKTGMMQTSPDCESDPNFVNPFPGSLNVRSQVAVPIMDGDRIIGVLDVENESPYSFKDSDVRILETVASQLATALLNAYQYESLKEQKETLEAYKEHIASDLSVASKLQKNLLPSSFVHPKLEIKLEFLPHHDVGGDYAKVEAKDEWIYLIIGDVSGHGIAPALVMSGVNSEVSRHISAGASPSEIVQCVNGYIAENFGFMGLYLTLFCARIDTRDSTMSYVNAGHPPVIVQFPDRQSVMLESTNFPLGLLEKEFPKYLSEEHMELPPGSRIILYTDGVLAERGNGLSTERLFAEVESLRDEELQQVAERIIAERKNSLRDNAAEDDILLLVAEFRDRVRIFERFSTYAEVDGVVKKLVRLAKAMQYSEDEAMILHLSAYEMMINAVMHGHDNNVSKTATITGSLLDDSWELTITDEGEGFDFRTVEASKVEDDDIFKISGRGIALTRRILDTLDYANEGKTVHLARNMVRAAGD